MKTNVVIGIGLAIFLVACSSLPEITGTDIVECNEGRYTPQKELVEKSKLMGREVTELTIVHSGQNIRYTGDLGACYVYAVYNSGYSEPIMECGSYAVDNALKAIPKDPHHQNKTKEQIESVIISRICTTLA